jgi:hypothetical protein
MGQRADGSCARADFLIFCLSFAFFFFFGFFFYLEKSTDAPSAFLVP